MTSLLPTGKQINLQLGWPSPALFPSAELNASADAVLTDANAASAALIYGPNRGSIPLRKEVAQWLGSTYHKDPQAIDEGRVCIAGGASQNLANTLLRFTDPTYTRCIWMVEPTYFLACPVFEDCGFIGKLRGVPEDNQGIDLNFLRAALAENEADFARTGGSNVPELKTPANGYEKIFKHVIYVVPTFSNPSGKTMSLQHRYDLVRLAIEYDALIISDDVYDFLYWPQERDSTLDRKKLILPPRLVDVNREIDPHSKWGNTMSNGSFSKVVAPGLRVSWAEATCAFAAFLANTGATTSGGNPGHFASTFVERLLSSGALQNHIQNKLTPCYSARYYAMVDAIRESLEPLGVQITTGTPYSPILRGSDGSVIIEGEKTGVKTAGGFFLLITLPKDLPPPPVLAKIALEQQELKFAYGKMFEVKGDNGSRQRSEIGFGSTVRLCWAFHDEEAIVEGIKRMREIMIQCREATLKNLPATI
ncbi:pyridoxal phosphate-dependent transferase [Dactylonectria estremocensis]|uniref:Pyridoxal phosphate-dependent transferase n=1 Tax=Dactylonectria estremocensis TaxID=1079267 RepID=A0A9P9DYS5_9HYPO|nr:pyridoxal phosphate-dependent transferase [Dactylonectria estremocensis]